MSEGKVVPKWRAHRWAIALGILFLALTITAYVCWTRLSAQMALRWFVRHAGIPVEVRSASWDARIGEILKGKIRALHLELYYEPLDLPVVFDSPVSALSEGGHWSIRLEPDLEVGHLPPVVGTLAIEMDIKHEGSLTSASNVAVEFHLHERKALQLRNATGELSAGSWNLDGYVSWAALWNAHVDLSLNNVKAAAAKGPTPTTLTAKTLKIGADVSWPLRPPFPLDAKIHLTADDLSFLKGSLFLTEPQAVADAAFHFDGKSFTQVDISVDKPAKLTARGALSEGSLDADFSLTGDLDSLFTQRAAQWLEAEAPLLHRASATGTLSLAGKAWLRPQSGFGAKGRVKLVADKVDFPNREISATGLAADLPLVFPGDPDWGSVRLKTFLFHSVTLKNLVVDARVGENGVDVTSEGEDGKDRPIRQSVWGGSIDIEDLYAHTGGAEGTEFTASVKGGPFQIPAIQNDLCLMRDNPIRGQVSFTYPQIVLDKEAITLDGDINIDAFNGKAHVGDLKLTLGSREPRLLLSFDWSDLDLQAIGSWTNIGDIRGSLFGSLTKADFALTPKGVYPNSYEFTFRGSQRGGNKMSFYGRALDNVMRMLGASPDTLPAGAALILKLTMLVRNWAPAHADVMGFKANATADWTELTTFDPPPPEEDSDVDRGYCKEKMHYILCGTGFTIPLNTHGVYPLLMRTTAFHQWLNDRVKYVGSLMASKKQTGRKNDDTSQCTPLF